MAYPAGVSLAVLTTGSASDFFGADAAITATVTPVLKGTSHIVHAATGAVMVPAPQVFTAGEGEGISFSVPHTDQDGWLDGAGNAYKGWYYKVALQIGRGRTGGPAWTKTVAPVLGQALVDLDLVAGEQIGVPVSAPVASVLSIAGLTGVVSEEQLQALGLGGASDPEIAGYVQDPESVTGAAVDSRVSSLAAPVENTAYAAYPFLATLQTGGRDVTMLNLSDSTGALTTGYLSQALDRLKAQWPQYGTSYTHWDATAKAWGTTEARTTGTAGTIRAYNAGLSGSRFQYPQAHLTKMIVDVQPDLVFINYGHNEGSTNADMNGFREQLTRLVEIVRSLAPAAVVIVMAQNPRYDDPTYSSGLHLKRVNTTRDTARLLGVGFVDIYQAFLRTGNPRDYIREDLLHPNDAGQQLMTDTLMQALKWRPQGQPLPASEPSLLTQVRNIIPNGDFANWATSPGAPANFAAENCTVEKSTAFFENMNGYSMKITPNGGAQARVKTSPSGLLPINLLRGKWVTMAARIYVPAGAGGNAGKIQFNGSGASAGNDIVSAEGGWKWEITSKLIPATGTYLEATIYADTSSSATSPIYLDRVILCTGLLPRDIY